MSRVLTVGAAQMGPIQLADTRPEVVERLVALLRSGAAAGCDLVAAHRPEGAEEDGEEAEADERDDDEDPLRLHPRGRRRERR